MSVRAPRISIITPSYGQGAFIEETIRSVLAQDYPDFEHIVVDGGSRDQTLDILRKFPHLRWVSERDRGQADAINKGLRMATGEILAYLNSDDLYRPGAFRAVADFFAAHPEARIVAGGCDVIDERSRITGHLRARYGRLEDLIRYWGWDRWVCIPQPAVFWRRALTEEAGPFDASLHMTLDYDMWLRAAARTPIHTLPETLAAFRLAAGSKTTSRTHEMYLEEFAVSRRYWSLLPRRRRAPVMLEARRHVARKLLDSAEHYSFHDVSRSLVVSLLGRAAGYWPPLALAPRWWLTLLQALAPSGGVRGRVRWLHRAYLGFKWKLGRGTRSA